MGLSSWQTALDAHDGVLGLAIALTATTLLAAGFAFGLAPHARTRWSRLGVVGPPVFLCAQTLAVLGALVAAFRTEALEAALGWPAASARGASPLLLEAQSLTLLAVVLGLAVPVTLLAASRTRARRGLLRGLALIAGAAGAALAAFLFLLHEAGPLCLCWGSWHRHVLETSARFDLLTAAPFAAAAVAWVALAWARRRAPAPAPWRHTFLASLVAAGGLALFLGAAPYAWDRDHPVSLRAETLPASVPRARPAARPGEGSSARCAPATIGPVLSIEADAVLLDGRVMREPARLREDLETIRRNWAILQPRARFPGTVLVAAPEATSWRALDAWLGAAHEAGYTRAQILTARDRTVHTATRDITVPEGCAVDVTLSPYIDSAEAAPTRPVRYAPGPFAAERWATVGDALDDAADGPLGYAYLESVTGAW